MSGPGVVVVTSRSFGAGDAAVRAQLERAGLAVVRASAAHDPGELAGPLSEAVAWIAGTAPVTEALLAAAPRLKVIARYGVGVDSVDLPAAARRGIVVTNTPGANSAAVAEHAVTLMLASLRHVAAGDRDVRRDCWRSRRGREIGSLRIGVVGAGRVGRGVLARMRALGAEVCCTDPFLSAAQASRLGAPMLAMAELAAACDVVTLHAPGGQLLIDERWLTRSRRGQLLVNTARADLVDERAVAAALHAGQLGGYAADTLATERDPARQSPLLDPGLRDRVLLTPHIAAQTAEAIDRMGGMAVANVLAVLAGAAPPNPVDPEEL